MILKEKEKGRKKMGSHIGSITNVKIFVLYLMENINYPLDFITINDIIMQTDYVMYLDFAEAFNALLDGGLVEKVIDEGEEKYVVTDKGAVVARELKSDIIKSILDQSLTAAFRYLDFKKRGIAIKCTVEKNEAGKYDVCCTFHERGACIFKQFVTVDTVERANTMKANFYERPEAIFRGVHALLEGNVNYLFD